MPKRHVPDESDDDRVVEDAIADLSASEVSYHDNSNCIVVFASKVNIPLYLEPRKTGL